MPDLPGFVDTFARQRSWEWNFGHAPAFSHQLDERFGWGGVELHFDVEKGVIGRAQIFSDAGSGAARCAGRAAARHGLPRRCPRRPAGPVAQRVCGRPPERAGGALSLVAGGAALTFFSPMGRVDHKIKRGARKAPFCQPPSTLIHDKK